MKSYDDVYDSVCATSYEIDLKTADYIFPSHDIPHELHRKLVHVQQEIDRLAALAKRHVEDHEGDFEPTDTYFEMPATISIHWDREDKRLLSAGVRVDTGWSPNTVTDENDVTHPSDDSQCAAWSEILRNELNGHQIV